MSEEDKNERYIEKEIIHKEKINDAVSNINKKPNKKKYFIILSIVIILIIAVFLIFISTGSDNKNKLNQIIPPENLNNIANKNLENANIPIANIAVNKEVVLSGRVFIKAYGTPSESYGIISNDGNEIGFGAYDSMREQFRPYVNEIVTVTFSNICKSTTFGCCRSVFYYCGTVSDWGVDDK